MVELNHFAGCWAAFQKMRVWNDEKSFRSPRGTVSATVADGPEIVQPEKPPSTGIGPDAEKTSISGKVLEEEFIDRQ
jgi:hypothetical protein